MRVFEVYLAQAPVRDAAFLAASAVNSSSDTRCAISNLSTIDGVDFVSFLANTEKPTGGRPLVEYALTMDMAKELAMVERNEKGKRARAYFLQCERVAMNAKAAPVALTQLKALKLAVSGWETAEGLCRDVFVWPVWRSSHSISLN